MPYLRYAVAALLLFLGAFNAILCWNVETCTGNAADSLHGGVLTLAFNILGWWAMPKQSTAAIASVAAAPAIVMAFASFWTLKLAAAWSACEVITGAPFEPSGDETWFVILWIVVCFAFWGSLAEALKTAARNKEEAVEQN